MSDLVGYHEDRFSHDVAHGFRMDVGEAEELYSAYGGTTPRSKVN